MPREHIRLACTECKARNYDTTKNKQKQKNRLEVSKFCPSCRKHTPHREAR
jgi:large subunit ribosomal protein L33